MQGGKRKAVRLIEKAVRPQSPLSRGVPRELGLGLSCGRNDIKEAIAPLKQAPSVLPPTFNLFRC